MMQIADTLAERMIPPRRRTVPTFSCSKHPKGPRLIEGRFDAEQATSLVVHFDAIAADIMSHADAQLPPLQPTGMRLTLVVFAILTSQEGEHLLGVEGKHRMFHQLTIESLSFGNIGKEQIGGVLRLIDAPVMGHAFQFALEQWIDPSGVTFQERAPVELHETISHLLGQSWIVQMGEGIVDLGEGALLAAELLGEEVMPVDIDLASEGCPSL